MKLKKLLRLLALAAAICCLAACAAEKAPAETDEPALPEADANTEAAPQALPVALHGEGVGLVLLLGTELTDGDLRTLPQLPVPLVLLDNASAETDVNSITMDNRNAIRQALRYLHELGHKKIGFLANQTPSSNCMARERAYCEAVRENEQEPQIFRVNPTPDEAYRAVHDLLAQGERFPTALIANNDSIALGAIKALREAGLRIPEDVSVIGFDNIPLSGMAEPPLSTMEVPCKEMGIWAARLLCDCIQYPFSAPVKMQISTRLLPRKSTAAIHLGIE